ncbi:MetQ/NlpA family ABC transporter substrate-binding protein [Saccharopolyspora sp. 6M]|uniref:MetQ/NlpA family ABC transporter substrate-binding protein n=1 Tax=Saccharopolyspora sp. 6M TaxID=2877237 RepID=UPI001CD556BC|nr:MetQ/NlpA family ABC transporter substrate-binding protein [Saccharopolyspora sp. 6M]MCA1228825.1 methionine ABC transporter substrate-binding protein [Saccharopolyspora sp. 6M]
MSARAADELPEKPRRSRRGLLVAGLALVVVLIAGAVFAALGTAGSDGADGRITVRIGATDASKEYWTTFRQLAAEHGIDLRTVAFSDYNQANPALAQGQIDVNLFQHLLFLADHNAATGDTLTPIGSTSVVPLNLYSRRHADLADIPAGGTVTIPNDATNQARALLVLQQAGLISLRGGGNPLSTVAEIDAAASKVRVLPVDAAQTVASLPSADAAVVNNNYALDADLDPSRALFGDDPAGPAAQPYTNVFVTRAEDADDPTYAKLVELYRDERVAGQVAADSRGTAVPVRRSPAELRAILAELTDEVRAAGDR